MAKSPEGYLLVSWGAVATVLIPLLMAVGGMFWNNNRWTGVVDEKMVNFGREQAAASGQVAAMRNEMLPRAEAVAEFRRLDQRIDSYSDRVRNAERSRIESVGEVARQEMRGLQRALRLDQEAAARAMRPQ